MTQFDVEELPNRTKYYFVKGEGKTRGRRFASSTQNGFISLNGQWEIYVLRDLLRAVEMDLVGYTITCEERMNERD